MKIKVSGELADDVERVRELASYRGAQARFSLDGNQGYRLEGARELIRRLDVLGLTPDCFEQPLPADDWEGHRHLSESIKVPVCLDESISCARDALRAINERTADMINLKIMKAGLGETLRIAQLAKAGGLRLMIGGMLESEIAMGVSLQLAVGVGGIDQVDLDTPFFLTKTLTLENPWRAKQAALVCPMTPGHGLTRI